MEKIQNSETDTKYIRARKRVDEIKGFYSNLASYCLVIPFLIFINYKTSWGFQWFWFPLAGWGLGLSIHAYHVFVNNGVFGRKWEARKLQEFINQEEKKERWN
tara:strand:- start:11580 stop:11888 length:309 start_codon:yes stop_codon:yes gene_type:complete